MKQRHGVPIYRPPPRLRPAALAAVGLAAGLLYGLEGRGGPWMATPAALLLVFAVGARILRRRAAAPWVALLAVAVAGASIGSAAVRAAARDCRFEWRGDEKVHLRGLALTYLPAGERGGVEIRPLTTPHKCVWTGPVRVYASGPALPGHLYRVEGRWRRSAGAADRLRPPYRGGWIVADRWTDRGNAGGHPLLSARATFARGVWNVYPPRWAPLAEALVLGQREAVDPELRGRFTRAGLAHLLAISGLHVGLIAAALLALARALRLPSIGARLSTLAAVCTYVLLIGAPASAVRAALMIGFLTLGRLSGRGISAYDVVGLAATLLMLIQPWSIVEPGFQLSFAGATAIAFANGEVRAAGWGRGHSPLVRGLIFAIAASLVTLLLTAPISATHFGRVTPAALLGNLVAVPLIGLAMPALFLSAAASPWPALAAWPASAGVVLLRAVDAVAGWLSLSPWASIDVPAPGPVVTGVYVVLLVLAGLGLRGAWYRRRLVLALGFAGAAAVVGPSLQGRLEGGRLRVYVLDVGQGDAIAIATPGRHWLLVDAGPNVNGFDAGRSRVVPFLRRHGVRRLEAWLVSHPDLDHVGGGPAVLRALDVSHVVGPGWITGQVGQLRVLRELARDSVRWIRGVAGARLAVDEVTLRFLHPEAGGDLGAGSTNDISIVFLLEYAKFRMLFTGDISAVAERELLERHRGEIRATVLKVAHHGSATSTSRPFLEAVNPELAVISVGQPNRYGHPAPEVMYRLAADSIVVRRTDRDGTVFLEVDRDGRWRVRSAAEVW